MVSFATINRQRQNAGLPPLSSPAKTTRAPEGPSRPAPAPSVDIKFPKPANVPSFGVGQGGNIQTTPDPQSPTFEDVGIAEFTQKNQQPSAVVRSTRELQQLFDDGIITPDQFSTSRDKLLQGFTGVNPFGFTQPGQQVGGTKFDPETGRPSAVAGVRSQQQQPVQGAVTKPKRIGAAERIRSIASQPVENRLANAGVDANLVKLFNIFNEGGFQGTGSSDGRMSITAATPEFMQKLRDAGIRFTANATGSTAANESGNRNLKLSIGDAEFREKMQLFESISSGEDIQQEIGAFEESFAQDAQETFESGAAIGKEQPGAGAGSAAAAESAPTFQGMGAAFSNLPEEAQFLAPFFQQFLDSSQQNILENQGVAQGLLGRSQDIGGQISSRLNQMSAGHRSTQGAIQDLVDQNRAQTERYLGQRKRSEQERLSNTEQQGLRKIAKRKVENHDSMVAQLALGGGFGQDAGLQAVRESDEVYETAMQDFRTEVGLQRGEMNTRFSGLYLENQNTYINATVKNIKDTQALIDAVSFQDIENTKDRAAAEDKIIEKAWENQVTLRTQLAKDTLGVAETINSFIADEKQAGIDKETDGVDALLEAAKLWGENTPPEYKKYLQEQLSGTDIDVDGVLSVPTANQTAKAEKGRADGLVFGLMNKSSEDAPGFLGLLASRAFGRRSIRGRIDEAPIMHDMFERNDEEGVKEQILVTVENSFDTKTRRELDAIRESQVDIDLIQEKLLQFDDKFGGIFKETLEKGRRFTKNRDAEWFRLKSDIGLAMAETRKKFAGVAVTDTELASLNQFLVDFTFDTVGEMKIKLDGVRENLLIAKQSKYEGILGQNKGYYKYLSGEGIDFTTAPTQEQKTQYNDAFFKDLPSQGAQTQDQPESGTPSNPEIVSFNIGDRKVQGQPELQNSLAAADDQFFKDTGEHIIIGGGFRTRKQQEDLYEKSLRGAIGRAAAPGSSFHEKGLAVDIVNWEAAEPYLRRYGMINDLDDDKGHFSIGEFSNT